MKLFIIVQFSVKIDGSRMTSLHVLNYIDRPILHVSEKTEKEGI